MNLCELASLIVLNADDNGNCPRETLRLAYIDHHPGHNRSPKTRAPSPPPPTAKGERSINRRQQLAAQWKGERFQKPSTRYTTGGRTSSHYLQKDLARLEAMGFIRRADPDTVLVTDWAGIAWFMKAKMETGKA